MMMQAAAKPNEESGLNSRDQGLFAIGRLKEGVSRAQAEADLETINRQLLQAYPAPPDGETYWRGLPLSLGPAQGTLYSGVRRRMEMGITLVTILTGAVLLIACANVANLLLARAAAWRKEIAVRLALGAGRMRLIRQLLTESMLLALLAAAAGSLLAFWINRLLMSVQPAVFRPYEMMVDLRMDGRALVFTLLLSMLTSVIFGLAPAWAATRADVVPALKEESGTIGRRHWFSLRSSLIVAQFGLSLALLISAGLFIRSMRNAQAIDPGFDTSDGLLMTLDLGMLGYSKERGLQFYRQLAESLATTPGVRSAAVANYFPIEFEGIPVELVSIEGQPPPADGQPITVVRQLVGLRYLETIGIPLLRGRDFTAQDTASSERVVIINETMARRQFKVVGKAFRFTTRFNRVSSRGQGFPLRDSRLAPEVQGCRRHDESDGGDQDQGGHQAAESGSGFGLFFDPSLALFGLLPFGVGSALFFHSAPLLGFGALLLSFGQSPGLFQFALSAFDLGFPPAPVINPPSRVGKSPARTREDLPLPDVPTTARNLVWPSLAINCSLCPSRPKKRWLSSHATGLPSPLPNRRSGNCRCGRS